jgi:hypothetical protein
VQHFDDARIYLESAAAELSELGLDDGKLAAQVRAFLEQIAR